ncbi:MAG: amino acid carrier protein, partial [Acidobacteriota bacterium]
MPLSQEILDAVKHFIFGLDHVVWNWPSIMPIMVVALLGTGIITTFRLSWIQIRRFWHGIRVLKGDYDDPEHEGDLSHFQALSTALSGTIGIGNIAGVATAIHYGGPGALFWMWVTAVFGMALKFTECTLAQWFRKVNDKGQASGGPMYYIEQGLGPKWKWMAVAFACFAAITPLGMGDAVQSFTVADQFRHDFGVPTLITGIVIVIIVGAVILGGIRRIGKVTSKLVPFMCAVYILAGLVVLLLNANEVIPTLGLIFRSAFQPAAQIGGFAGGGFIFMMTWGVKRGLFSNESGLGSAPIIHAAARTDQPVREGVVAMLGPFVDTLTVCSITGLVILTTGVWNQKSMQRLPVSEQSALVTVVSGTHIHKDGVLPPDKIAAGIFRVDHGHPEGFEMVRNNSTLASMEILRAKGHFLDSGVKPFTGTIMLKKDDGGDPAVAVFRDAGGGVVSKRH